MKESGEFGAFSGFTIREKLTALSEGLSNGQRQDAQIPGLAVSTFESTLGFYRLKPQLRSEIGHYVEFYKEGYLKEVYPQDPEKADWTANLVKQTIEAIKTS